MAQVEFTLLTIIIKATLIIHYTLRTSGLIMNDKVRKKIDHWLPILGKLVCNWITTSNKKFVIEIQNWRSRNIIG